MTATSPPAGAPPLRPAALRGLHAVLALVPLLFLVCLWQRWILFGSFPGRWFHPYVTPGAPALAPFLLLAPLLAAATVASERLVRTHEKLVLAAWLVLAFAVQLYLHSLDHYSLARIIVSDGSNSFYNAALAHRPAELLRDFVALAPSLPLHARTNLPGKIIFYDFVLFLSHRPEVVAWIVIAISNLGAVLTYAVAEKLFHDRRASLYALILYLFIPAKTFFLAITNVLSPLFILLPLLAFLEYLDTRRVLALHVLGVTLYATVVWELTVLVMGVLFVALLWRAWSRGEIGRRELVAIAVHTTAAFLLAHLVLATLFGFDLVDALAYVIRDSERFNREQQRSYAIWVVHNMKEFLVNTGLLQSLLFAVVLVRSAVRWRHAGGGLARLLADPLDALAWSILVTLVITDLLGINRGEATRHWIFLAGFIQLVVARACTTQFSTTTFHLVLAATVLQTVATISLVAFVIP
jgi:hypothetical protein